MTLTGCCLASISRTSRRRWILTVTAPSEWEVAANYPVVSSSDAGEGRTTHVFTETPRISTYLFAFIAGPYKRYEDTWSDAAGETSLGVLCRESIAPYFDPDEFFQVTRDGLTFFSEFFDFRYPFDKYDQVFVPEFNMGAMENVGCITFSERMIFRDPPTEIQRLNRAEVVLHEMAHMWFGDLVTMRWWNDLWLNESFATYMAYLAMEHATRWSESAWSAFHARMKAWAYEQDQLPTTHPIAGRGSGHGRDVPEFRRHHLWQGRGGVEAARGVPGLGRLPRRDAGLLPARTRGGTQH